MLQDKPFRNALAALVLCAIPLALLGFLLLMKGEFADILDLRQKVDASIETREELHQLLAVHLDIETGQRGYVLTNKPEFLEPYLSGRARVADTIRLLDDEAVADPGIKPSIEHLKSLSRQKLAFAEESVTRARDGDFNVAKALISEGQGKRLMDAIRAEVGRLDALESARLEAVTRSRDASRRRIETTTYFLLAAFSLLLALITIVTARAMRERQREFFRANALGDRQQAVLNGTVDGLLVLDRDGYILETNPSVERLFGFDEAQLVGKHNTYLMADAPELAGSIAWLRTVGPAGRDGAGKRVDFTGRRVDGAIFETNVAVSRIATEGDARYVAIIQDVTDRKRVERMKTEFVSTVSHELRTPLTSIGGSLGLLAAGAVGPLGDKAARLVQIAHSNCERLIRLINDILDIEKIESGNMHFDLKRMRVAPLIDRVVAANTPFAKSHDVTLVAQHPAWPLSIEGDADRLEQLLTNLVSNAIKHSPKDGEVEVIAQQNARSLRIEVLDRGAGIPPEFRGRIFGKFAMADSSDSRARGGTGLGLSIAREIAERHGGSLGFSDRPGGGTVFHVDLPIVCEDASSSCEVIPGLPVVLHVDDDQDCLDVVASAFAGKATIVSVATLAEARTAIAEHPLAAAIVDVGLPPDSGLSLLPDLRSALPKTPIVLFTAIDDAYSGVPIDALLVKSRNSVQDLVDTTILMIARRKAA